MVSKSTRGMLLGTCLMLMIFLLTPSSTESKKILFFTIQYTSHLTELSSIMKGLEEKGHDVYIVLDENNKDLPHFENSKVKALFYHSPKELRMTDEELNQVMMETTLTFPRGSKMTIQENLKKVTRPLITNDCLLMLQDDNLYNTIKHEGFDLAVVDGLFYCGFLIPYRLSIPYMSVSTFPHVWLQRLHPVVSQQPCHISSETNTFYNRLKLFMEGYLVEKVLPYVFLDPKQVEGYAKEKPYSSLEEIVDKSLLWLVNQNPVQSCHSPSMPNVIQIGGLTVKPPRKLNNFYQSLVDGAQEGVILVSFGSGISGLPRELVEKFMMAFKQIKQVLIWRLTTTYDIQIPGNVKIVEWMPQNDLLAHKNVKLFITHCGNNGQTEAVHHGTPMIGFPLYGDQEYNAEKMAMKGFGIQMDIEKFTVDELVENINTVLVGPYSTTVQKASAILRSLPHPVNTSVYWIDHVMNFGSDHLKTALSDMNVVQFLMFDIYTFIVLTVLFTLYITKKIFSLLIRMLFKKSGDTSPEKKLN